MYGHLDQPLDLNRLADVACMSPYHWHRVYHGIYGETLANTVRRLRLHRAAGELVNTQRGISDIAKESGYGSVQAFNRVFSEHYGLPPAKYKQQGSHKSFQLLINSNAEGSSPMTDNTKAPEVIIKQVDGFKIIGHPNHGSYMNIGNAFEKTFGWLGINGLMPHTRRSIGIYYDDPASVPEPDLRSFAGAEIITDTTPEFPPGMEEREIPAGKYAVLQLKGPYSEMAPAYQWLYGVWLPASGEEVADQPCFEEYLNNPREVPATELLTNIYMPLK